MGRAVFKETHMEYEMTWNKLLKEFKCSVCGEIATNHIAVRETKTRFQGADYCEKHYNEKLEEIANEI